MPVLEEQDDLGQRVAVIAIHGVGEHEPGAMATDVKELLLTACGSQYTDDQSASFTLKITTEGLYSNDEPPASTPLSGFARLRRGMGSGFLHRRASIGTASPETSSVDQRFTRALLADGNAYTSDYTTVRHSIRRKTKSNDLSVDIFELHWSDLSHGGVSGSLKIADQFLQLLLHVASLGRTTLATVIDDLDIRGAASGTWRLLYRISAMAYWLLAMPILLGNLVFLLMGSLLAPALLPIPMLNSALAALTGAAAAFATGWGYFQYLDARMAEKARNSLPLHVVPLSLLAGIGIGILVWIYLQADNNNLATRLLATGFAAILLGGFCTYLMRLYDEIRPGALILWGFTILSLAALSCYVVVVAGAPGVEQGENRLLIWLGYISEGVYVALMAAWMLLFALNAALLLGAFLAGFRPWKEDETNRALGTALIAAALPAPLLLSVILAIWAAYFTVLEPSFPTVAFNPWLRGVLFQDVHTIKDLFHALIAIGASYVFVPYLILMAGAALLIVWGVLPSIKAELFRPSFHANPRSTASSITLGRWLDGGFMSMKWGVILAGIGFFFLFPYGILAPIIGSTAAPATLGENDWIAYVGAGVGASTAGYLAATKLFAKWFSDFFKRLRVVVDAALDVDNWLRERPRGNTPRLRIFARFSTLLTHIQSGNYSRIVVVAHSQGTVVATDFFRYLRLQFEKERFETLPPVSLLTMGCPLRQLYALRFPVLYRWVHRPPGAEVLGPNPEKCGFSQWVNAYGSGDYVGRYLWASDSGRERWAVGGLSRGRWPNATEFCLGPQAHTHYLDRDSVQVAGQLDALIA